MDSYSKTPAYNSENDAFSAYRFLPDFRADGLMIEVHNCPEKAASDGAQSLTPEKFDKLMKELDPIAKAVNKILL